METTQESDGNQNHPEGELVQQIVEEVHPAADPWAINREMFRRFFGFTGGSIFYCISAVLVAYGVAKVLAPVLSGTDTIGAALPCIGTLWVYELALLGVLVLIVSRKVVDDAISVVIIMALYLVASSIAAGSVADRSIGGAVLLAFAGVILGAGKLCAMRRYVHIPFGWLSIVGLVGLVAANYFGPILMAQSMAADPANESGRRGVWFLIWLGMLIAVGLVVTEAARSKAGVFSTKNKNTALLQSSVMPYALALVLLAASGVHQYAMAYMFALDKPLGDFLPATAMGTLLMLEILRRLDLRFGILHIAVACVPLAVFAYAIGNKSIYASGSLGLDIIAYPPVFCALTGAGLTVLSVRHRWPGLLIVVCGCLLGVILTAGFSPGEPHQLNTFACGGIVVAGLLVYGLVTFKQHFCLIAVAIMTFGLAMSDGFMDRTESWQLTQMGAVAGVAGLGVVLLYIVFGSRLHTAARIAGALCMAAFVFDYLPDALQARYVVMLIAGGLLATGIWLRARDWAVILILAAPLCIRLYLLAKHITHWRLVILGFVVLAAGTILSLKKSKTIPQTEQIEGP